MSTSPSPTPAPAPAPQPSGPLGLLMLPPAFPGLPYSRAVQPLDADGSTPGTGGPGPFLATDALTCSIAAGTGGPAIVTPACSWVDPAAAEFRFSFTGQQAAALDAAGSPYLVEVFVTRGTARWPLLAAYLPVLPLAGTTSAPSKAKLP